jgi:hypothetical protein
MALRSSGVVRQRGIPADQPYGAALLMTPSISATAWSKLYGVTGLSIVM